MTSSPGSTIGLEPPRKKMRKGTKSCIECRRRKIRCTYENDRPNICNECFARGSTCIDQEHAELQLHQSTSEQTYSLRERVTHLEGVIKDILHRLDDGRGPREAETERAAEVLKNLKSSGAASDSALPMNGSAPVLSLFDNAVLKRTEDNLDEGSRATESTFNQRKERKLRESLSALLPSQQDLNAVFQASEQWWRVWRRMFPELYTSPEENIKDFTLRAHGASSPATIAKTLLCTAISLDQLPADYPIQLLSLPLPADQMMEQYVSTVHELITSDDEYAGTIEGIECMLLETKHYVNVGRPRKAWLIFRRAIAFAQLLGIHRAVPTPEKQNDKTYQRHYNLWCALFQGDRYLSLILGLPSCIADNLIIPHIPKSLEKTGFPPGEFYLLNLMLISGRIIDRNQDPAHMSLSASLKIDQELEELKDSMPANMWSVELNPHEDIEGYYDRIIAQFFHHQIRTLLHLPFMLKSAADQRYQYSKIAAIEASRDMIVCYQALRADSGLGPYICKVLDFQAFTAAMLLLLNLLGYAQGTPYKDSETEEKDWELVSKTIDVLHGAANEPGGVIASQSAKALQLIASSRHGCEDCDNSESSKVVIPYFGTIRIGAGKNFSVPKHVGPNGMQLPTPPNSYLGSCNSNGATPAAGSALGPGAGAEYGQNRTPPIASASNVPGFPEDSFISFDSLWAMPPSAPSYQCSTNMAPSESAAAGEVEYVGDPALGGIAIGDGGWPNINGALELDQGWNWFGFGNDSMPS